MKPDVIVTHPKDIYYPLWMLQINRDHELFNSIIIIMTQGIRDQDYSSMFFMELEGKVYIKKYKDTGKDWRHDAVTEGLRYVNSPYILFLEQDFLVKRDFFRSLFKQADGKDMVGTKIGNRFHPACLLVKKEALDKTSKNFAVVDGESDHFAVVTQELEQKGNVVEFKDLTLPDWHHLAGLTQNFRLTSNFYKPEKFYTYLYNSLDIYPQPLDWMNYMKDKKHDVYLDIGGEPELDLIITSFFNDHEDRLISDVD